MANEEHVKVALKGAVAIREWRKKQKSRRIGFDLSNADLSNADLSYADLSYADLSYADLSMANLECANLRNANLRRALLRNAYMPMANLRNVDLRGANLALANLGGAMLNGADLLVANLVDASLQGADLRSASLKMAKLEGANLQLAALDKSDISDASLGLTILNHTDLSEVFGLESVGHFDSTEIGFETLIRSKGQIPRVFLQGCGLPDSYIDYIPSMINALNPIDFHSCFISYSHKDSAFVRRLHNDLQQEGIRCWRDEHSLKMGDEVDEEIEKGIRLWDKTILCASRTALESDWVEFELEKAFEQESENNVKKIIPIDLDGSIKDWKGLHGTKLRKRLAGDFRDWDKDNDKYEAQFKRLVEALNTAAQQEPPPSKLKPVDGDNA